MAIRSLLVVHLSCAAGAAVAFWVAALGFKGGPVHRAAGDWFRKLVYASAVPGVLLAAATPGTARYVLLYLLLVAVTPTHHGLAVVRAGPVPARVRSRVHATLNILALLASPMLLAITVASAEWIVLAVVPAGFLIGLNNLSYATRPVARPHEWEREHLTSVLIAGIVVHTALLGFVVPRSTGELTTPVTLLLWAAPAAIGLPVIAWLRSRRLTRDFLEEVDKT